MTDDNIRDALERWIRIDNKGHGYASAFNYENSDDKRIVEELTFNEWRKSVRAEFGVDVNPSQPNPNDPPDFFASCGGKHISIELVQLVEQAHKRRATKGENPSFGKLFQETQWSKERLISKLNTLISMKGEKYRRRGLEIDVLLVHTDEPWLAPSDANGWLSNVSIEPHPNIKTVSLFFFYEPNRGVDHWPVLTVYGELTQLSLSR